MGDRGEFSTPIPVLLHPDKAWKWIQKTIQNNEAAVEAHFLDPNNKTKPFKPKTKAGLSLAQQFGGVLCGKPQNPLRTIPQGYRTLC